MDDLPMKAVRLATDLERGHYSMADAIAMIRELALALDDARREARKAA